jgi:hypothetical protein
MTTNSIGPVGSISLATGSGYGFVLYGDDGKPCASFVYPDRAAAEAAAKHMANVLSGVKSVHHTEH